MNNIIDIGAHTHLHIHTHTHTHTHTIQLNVKLIKLAHDIRSSGFVEM